MKIESFAKKEALCAGMDATFIPNRDTSIECWPDATVNCEYDGNRHQNDKGLHIHIACRHNGSREDIAEAIRDAITLLSSIR
jgi:undecaprenyl pyrophosphate synthase